MQQGCHGTTSRLMAAHLARALLVSALAASTVRAEPPASSTPSREAAASLPVAAPWDLERCLRAALTHSPQVLQQRLVVQATVEKQGEARSHLLPRLSWDSQAYKMSQLYDPVLVRSGAYGDVFVPAVGGGYVTSLPPRDVELLEAGPTEFASTRLRLQQPVFTWGRILLGMQLAEANRHLEESALRATGFEVAALVRQLLLGLQLGEASLELLDTMHGEMQRLLDDTRAAEAQGLTTPATALEAEANLRQIEQEQARTRAELVRAREALRLLVGADPADPLRITGRLDDAPAATDDVEVAPALVARALSSRPELEQRALQLRLAEQQVALRRAEGPGRPTLALAAEAGLRGDRWPLVRTNWTMAWDHYWMAGLVLQVPLFDGLQARSQVGQAEAQRQQAALGLEQTRALVRAEVLEQQAQVEARRSELAHARARVVEAHEKWRVAEQGVVAGASPRSELLAAHLDSCEARMRALLALYGLRQGELELERAAGLLPRTPDEVGR